LLDAADAWNDNIERWVYATGGDLAQQLGVDGYYVRITPPDTDCSASPTQGFVPIKNRPPGENLRPAFHVVSPDSLALCDLDCVRLMTRNSQHSQGDRCPPARTTPARALLVSL